MKIAPGIDSASGKSLELDNAQSTDWSRAVDIFRKRIVLRYMDASDLLIEADEPKSITERRFGFAILAIDCLLIETLAAFRDGCLDTIGKSKAIFSDFLTSRPLFCKHFTTKSLAEQFYTEFRSGILHQAEVGGNSKVWSIGEVVQYDSGHFTINRTKFHELVKAEINAYIQELEDPNNNDLRTKFRNKMSFICR